MHALIPRWHPSARQAAVSHAVGVSIAALTTTLLHHTPLHTQRHLPLLPCLPATAASCCCMQLDNNRLETLPHTMSGCASLRILTAANNRLKTLPERLGDCGRLKHVVFDVNPLLDTTERVTAAVLTRVDATCRRNGGDLRAPGYVPVPTSDTQARVATAPMTTAAAAAATTPVVTAAAGAASGSRAATASASASAAASRRASAVDGSARPGIVIPATPATATRPAAAGAASAAGSAGSGGAAVASGQRPP